MRILWHVAVHDLRLHLSERANIFFLFLMPMGFVFFFALINADSGPDDVQVSLPVVDHDQEFLSIAFAEQLRGENFNVPVYSTAEAETTSFGTRFVTIPDSFTSRVLQAQPTKIVLTARATSNVSYDLAAQVRLHQAQVRFLGNLVRWSGVGDSTTTGLEGVGNPGNLDPAEMGRFLAMVSEPTNVLVESSYAGRGTPVPSGTKQSVPGVLVMFVVMTVLIGGSEALTKEKIQGTLRRLATTPLSVRQVLLGKALGLTLLGLAQSAILIVATELLTRFGVLGMDFLWGPHLLGVIPVLIAYCACIASLGLLISGLLRTPQQAESLAWLFGMMLSAMGGAWWPLEIMPKAMRLIGQFFPTSWAMAGLHNVITYGHGILGAVVPVLVLFSMAAVFWYVGSKTLRVVD